ncbi:hypothetical protein Ahy_B06g080211 isoform D [Arachis hypogaea]|uniref:Uncharacterized protein n=1 Tax=Arachis hypogaea TaxID=3818 RepID=A0A444YHC3_ARAHY|nr:hypothetical protein Ahy_B06g080211 isoform D [Arachis hypogaea]
MLTAELHLPIDAPAQQWHQHIHLHLHCDRQIFPIPSPTTGDRQLNRKVYRLQSFDSNSDR